MNTKRRRSALDQIRTQRHLNTGEVMRAGPRHSQVFWQRLKDLEDQHAMLQGMIRRQRERGTASSNTRKESGECLQEKK